MKALSAILVVAAFVLLAPRQASAHCDTTSGPVVTAARAALEAGDPDLVMHWVRPEDDAAVRSAFQQTLAVRALGPDAKSLADRYFFETVVRIHRAGEGAAYTGLSDSEPEPIIAATDRALERGATDELEHGLIAKVRSGLASRFAAADAAKDFRPDDVERGRAFVATYVALTHWVEGVYASASGSVEHHAAKAGHDESAHASAHTPAHDPGGHSQHLPWILAGVLAIVTVVQAGLSWRRRGQSST